MLNQDYYIGQPTAAIEAGTESGVAYGDVILNNLDDHSLLDHTAVLAHQAASPAAEPEDQGKRVISQLDC